MSDPSAAPLTPAVFHILLALADGPRHGYAIMKQVEATSGLRMGPGTVYGSLQRMEASGLVEERGTDPDDGRGRTDFAVTERGREAFRAEARRLAHLAALPEVKRALQEQEA